MNDTWRVASGHPETSAAAAAILDAGGNAADAAVAAVLAACAAEPLLCSLGGGGYALLRRPGHAPQLLDFFTQTPLRRRAGELDFYPITGDFGPDSQEFHIGMASIATPGMTAGLFELHRRYGHMPMSDIAAPAVGLARGGVLLNATQAYTLRILQPIVRATPEAARLFGLNHPSGALPAAGARMKNPELADFLEQLVEEGADAFYQGAGARALVADAQLAGGHLGAADLPRYRAYWRRPLAGRYRDAWFWTNPPPAFGGVLVAQTCSELERHLQPGTAFGSPAHLEALVTALVRTNALRTQLEQPENLACSRRMLSAWRALSPAPAFSRGTTHISVRDRRGMMLGVSVSNGEGSGYVMPGTGVMLNNMLGEEDLNRGGFHQWPCNRRIASMMAPVLLFTRDGRTMLGSGGSNRIRSTLAQVISNLVDFGLELTAAVQAPRLHVEGERVAFEAFDGGFAEDVRCWVGTRWPDARLWPEANIYFGGAHVVGDHDQAADARRSGAALASGTRQ